MRKRDLEMLAFGALLNQPPAPRVEYATREVIEKRAPTDESVRLLQKMEAAAWRKVTDAMAQEAENFFQIVTFKLEKNLETKTRHVHAVYSLNSKVFQLKIAVDEHEAGKMFWDAVAKEIAEQLTGAFCDAFMTARFATPDRK